MVAPAHIVTTAAVNTFITKLTLSNLRAIYTVPAFEYSKTIITVLTIPGYKSKETTFNIGTEMNIWAIFHIYTLSARSGNCFQKIMKLFKEGPREVVVTAISQTIVFFRVPSFITIHRKRCIRTITTDYGFFCLVTYALEHISFISIGILFPCSPSWRNIRQRNASFLQIAFFKIANREFLTGANANFFHNNFHLCEHIVRYVFVKASRGGHKFLTPFYDTLQSSRS